MGNIVIIGGGTGTSTLLAGLKNHNAKLSVIVSSWDDGGSNGRLRKELQAFPFSDVRQCLAALADKKNPWKEFFEYRFEDGNLKGHTAANLFLAGLQKIYGNVQEPLNFAHKLLGVKHSVMPVTLVPTVLSALFFNGKKIVGEHNIDEPKGREEFRIKNLELSPSGPANPRALAAIKTADAIVLGPGDLYTSVIPNLLVKGIKEAINKSKAKKVFVANLMTKAGQSQGYVLSDFVKEINAYLSAKIEYVIYNKKRPSEEMLKKYKKERAEMVEADTNGLPPAKYIGQPLLAEQVFHRKKGDMLKRSFLRHDSQKLAKIIWELIS